MATKKVNSARALVASGSLVRNCMPWSVGRSTGRIVDAGACRMILKRWPVSILLSGLCPPMVIVVYGHCCADNQNLMVCLRSMPNVFTGSCVRMRCCLSVNWQYRHRSGRIQGKWSLEKVTSGGALTASDSAVIMAKNCRSRSRWNAAIVKHCTGRQVPVDMTVKPYRTSCWLQ
ncbi:Uncharacterised protein [Klebsiella pneumoniae]|nr:Uncharacterised protein [Klebsiella pneumoniae]